MNKRLSLVTALALNAFVANAATPVTFSLGKYASPRFAKSIATGGIEGTKVTGYEAKAEMASADCLVQVQRPEGGEAPAMNAKNAVSCEFTYADGKKGTAVLSLAKVSVAAWGNRLDQYPIAFEGPMADKFFTLLQQEYKDVNRGNDKEESADPGIYRLFAAAPTGAAFTVMYGYNRMGKQDSTASFDCAQSAEIDGSSELTKGKTTGFTYEVAHEDGSKTTFRSYSTQCKLMYFGKDD